MSTVLSPSPRRGARGFTLIEVLMAIAIIGILVSLGIPSYQRYVYRAEATELVLKVDRLRSALAELEASTGMKIGSQLYLGVRAGDGASTAVGQPNPTPAEHVLVWCPLSGGRSCGRSVLAQPVSGIASGDLELARLGIRLSVNAGGYAGAATSPGTFLLSVVFPAGNPHGTQVGHAFVDLIRPHAQSVLVGSQAAILQIPLHAPGKT